MEVFFAEPTAQMLVITRTLSNARESTIAFTGPSPATFAFGAVPCVLRSDAAMVFGLEVGDTVFGDAEVGAPRERPVFAEAGLLTFDEP